MLGEPAWDMLLVLYTGEHLQPQISVGRLTKYSGAPSTTALRWLDYLSSQGLINREHNHLDKRSVLISLSDRGRTILDNYFAEVLELISQGRQRDTA